MGWSIKKIQEALKELGYYTAIIDGKQGTKTTTAIKSFQKKEKISETGKFDDKCVEIAKKRLIEKGNKNPYWDKDDYTSADAKLSDDELPAFLKQEKEDLKKKK